jgi:hypothetical protein
MGASDGWIEREETEQMNWDFSFLCVGVVNAFVEV